MRELKSSGNNEITLNDFTSDTLITFFYRTPTTRERLQYNSAVVNAIQKNGNKIETAMELQIEWTLKMLTGFEKGSLSVDGKAISSDERDKDYYPGWKELLRETASELLLSVGEVILGKPNMVVKKDFFSKASSTTTTTGGQKKKKSST